MKVLVTGGAGFIGGNFVHHMVNKYPDYQIVNLDLLTYAGNLETLKPVEDKPNYKFVKGDIADEAFIMDLFEKEKFDVVVNFAAESHVDRSIEDPGIFVQTNVMGTRVLLDASRKFGVKRYHQVSTDEVYGDLPLDRPDLFFTENTPIHTSSPYSASKASADLFVLAYHRTYGLPVTISRCAYCENNCCIVYPALQNEPTADMINASMRENIMAKAKKLDMAVFVLDYDYNAPSAEHLAKTHEPFFKAVRKANPDVPVIMLSKCSWISPARRDIIKKTYDNAVRGGDKNVWFIDGQELFGEPGQNMCTVDHCHPNDLGFYMMYRRVLPVLLEALKSQK